VSRIPRAVWLFALIFALAAALPYVVGYLNAPSGGAFTGNALEQARVDYNSHLAKMQLGLGGAWGYRILFTPEEHPAVLIQPFYLALGNLARLLGLPLDLVYHAARLIGAFGMVVAIWLLVARFLESPRVRWTAFLLATVTGGAGWLLYLIAPAQTTSLAPIEFWLFDAYTFLAALTFPHFCAAILLLVGLFLSFDGWLHAPTWKLTALVAGMSLLLGWIQPFDLLLTALVIAALTLWALVRGRLVWRQALRLIPVALAHAIPVIYHYAALESHPVWRAFNAQNITLSPPPVYYLFGYAWLLVPAISGVLYLRHARDGRLLLPVVWTLLTAILVYVPLQVQRRYLMGVQVPLAVLAAVGLEQVYGWWSARGGSQRWGRLLLTAGLLLSALSHALLLASVTLTANPASRPLLFLTADDLDALAWLRAQPPEAVALAAFSSGGRIPAYTGRRVYLGHWIETMNFPARQRRVQAFFDPAGMSDAERLALLEENGVDVVWYDAAARMLGSWSPDEADFLRPAFVSDSVTIYEVAP